MATTNVIAISYEKSESLEIQGKREEIEKYLDKGYGVKKKDNGYWLLVKSAQIIVTLSNGNIQKKFNIKEDILNHYGRKRMNKNLLEKFKQDIEAGLISLKLDSNESYSFV